MMASGCVHPVLLVDRVDRPHRGGRGAVKDGAFIVSIDESFFAFFLVAHHLMSLPQR